MVRERSNIMQSSKKHNCTIDEKHKEMLETFHHNEIVIIPQIKEDIIKIKIKISKTSKKLEEYLCIIFNKISAAKNTVFLVKLVLCRCHLS